jgi:hypothetical protein
MYENDPKYRAERKANALAWKAVNRDKNVENKARWYQEAKVRLRKEWNERFRTDPVFRLRNNLRRSIWEALEQGRKDAEAFREANPLTFRDTGMRYI